MTLGEFRGARLERVITGSGLTSITRTFARYKTSLTYESNVFKGNQTTGTKFISNSVTSFNAEAFTYCCLLTEIRLPNATVSSPSLRFTTSLQIFEIGTLNQYIIFRYTTGDLAYTGTSVSKIVIHNLFCMSY